MCLALLGNVLGRMWRDVWMDIRTLDAGGRYGMDGNASVGRILADGDGVLEMHCAYALRTDGMFSDGEIREVKYPTHK